MDWLHFIHTFNHHSSTGALNVGISLPRKSTEAARHWDKRRHLAQAQHRDEHNGADDGVAQQDGSRTARRQRLARAEEQPSANGASNGNHLDLARREGALEVVLGFMTVVALDVVDVGNGRRAAVIAICIGGRRLAEYLA